MRQTIDTAPKDGKFVIIVDDTSGHYDIARWSAAREWIRENGEPSGVRPSHWNPISGENYPALEIHQSSSCSESEVPLQLPITSDAPSTGGFIEDDSFPSAESPISASVEAKAAPAPPRQRSYGRSALAISVALIVGLATAGVYYRTEAITLWARFESVVKNQIQLASRGVPRPTPSVQSPDESGHDKNQAAPQDDTKDSKIVQTAPSEARQLLEKAQLGALTNELIDARHIIDAINQQLQATTTKARSLEQERDQTKASRKQMEADVQQLRASIEEGQARVAALTSQLSAVRRDLETQTALASKAQDETKTLSQTAEGTTAELRRSLQEERDKTASLAHDLEAAQRLIESRTRAEATASTPIAQAKVGAEPASDEPKVQESPEAARLMARASALLAQGDIGAARTVLERALDAGSVKASFALAETYDPNILARWGTFGTRGDASKARELYEKASADGIREAKARINALN